MFRLIRMSFVVFVLHYLNNPFQLQADFFLWVFILAESYALKLTFGICIHETKKKKAPDSF